MKNLICILSLVLIALSCAQAQRVAVATPDPGPDCPSSGHTFIPYKGDCNKFWECYAGQSFVFSCPVGLWFHPEHMKCELPGDFCTDGIRTSGWTSTSRRSISSGSSNTQGDLPDCTGTGDDPVYYPYPGDCTKYYECANGRLYTYNCPPDLWWHQEISECDYPGDFCVPDTRHK